MDNDLTKSLTDLTDASRAQTAGLMKMLAMMATQQGMLKEILAALTAPEPEGPSPLVKAVVGLQQMIHDQGIALGRIETAVTHRG